MLLVLCFVCYGGRDPDKNLTVFAYAAQIVMFFVCSVLSSLTQRQNPVSGAVTACALLLLIMFAASLVMRGGAAPDITALWVLIGDIAVSAVGIIIGVKRAKPDAKKLRRNIISKYRQK